MTYKYFLFAIVLSFLSACSFASHSEKTKQDDTIVRVVPTFNPDSAYQYVKAQCDFGPRVPGTEAHTACNILLSSLVVLVLILLLCKKANL